MNPTDAIDAVRRPEYTGENRCIPCTVANSVIAVAAAAALGGSLAVAGAGAAVAAVAGGVVLFASAGAIYLRGYLVPGTPTLTKRYFPDRVLRWFDKAPAEIDAPVAGSGGQIEAEPILMEAGAVELCQGGEDLCATDAFAADWREEVERLRGAEESALAERMAAVLDTELAAIDVAYRSSFAMVRDGGQPVARWESRAALLADAAAYPWLADRVDAWDDLDLRDRGQLLNGARVFLERCPACDGPVAFSEDTVESCCREIDVVALSCSDCESLLLEVEV